MNYAEPDRVPTALGLDCDAPGCAEVRLSGLITRPSVGIDRRDFGRIESRRPIRAAQIHPLCQGSKLDRDAEISNT